MNRIKKKSSFSYFLTLLEAGTLNNMPLCSLLFLTSFWRWQVLFAVWCVTVISESVTGICFFCMHLLQIFTLYGPMLWVTKCPSHSTMASHVSDLVSFILFVFQHDILFDYLGNSHIAPNHSHFPVLPGGLPSDPYNLPTSPICFAHILTEA